MSLSLVYVLFAAHIIHWKLTGKTLAPLELNEVMYTLELGIITAGFLFMCLLFVGTLLFGRFFCSWACHIMVLQDLCAWVLRRMGIRRKPIRSRLLLWVPLLTALYMFVWPQIARAYAARAFPEFHFRSDAQGWASFMTENFWRNLPSAPIIVLTFVVCGFLIVYLLGSRSFCTYVCPYGAIFSVADRFSPGRIRVSDACTQCATCTAVCTSGIRVHEEVKQHGMIVNPACLKDLDCVANCPQGALGYTFSKPALFRSFRSGGRFGRRYDFALGEEILMAVVFVGVMLTFRGLYSRVPFLLALALGAIFAYLTILTVRLGRKAHVVLSSLVLKRDGKLTSAGGLFVASMAALGLFVAHSAFVRYHEYFGLRGAWALSHADGSGASVDSAQEALAHLSMADRWGLSKNERVERCLMDVSWEMGRFDDVDTFARRVLERRPDDAKAHIRRGQALVKLNRTEEGERQFRMAIDGTSGQAGGDAGTGVLARQALGDVFGSRGAFAEALLAYRDALTLAPRQADLHAAIGGALAEMGRFDEALNSLREAIRLDPQSSLAAGSQFNLGALLARQGRFPEAVDSYQHALELNQAMHQPDDPDLLNNLAFALLRLDRLDEARRHLERAIAIDPDNADAHFNLATLFASQHEMAKAQQMFLTAAKLDPRYARLLGGQGDALQRPAR